MTGPAPAAGRRGWAGGAPAALAGAALAGTALPAVTGCGPGRTARHHAAGPAGAATAPAVSSPADATPNLIPKGHAIGAGSDDGTARSGSGPARTGHVPPADPCAHNHHCTVPPAPIPTPHWTRATEPTRPGDLPPTVPTITGAPAG